MAFVEFIMLQEFSRFAIKNWTNDIEILCDRAMFVKDGHIEILGKVPEVLESYKKYMSTLEE